MRQGSPSPGVAERLIRMAQVKGRCEELGHDCCEFLMVCIKMEVAVDAMKMSFAEANRGSAQAASKANDMIEEYLFFQTHCAFTRMRYLMDVAMVPRETRLKLQPFILMALTGMNHEMTQKAIEAHDATKCEDPTCWFDLLNGPAPQIVN